MTNEEKYKTPEERQEAFETFCESQRHDNMPCSKCCELRNYKGKASCEYLWLALEAEEEYLLPCPFCGYPNPYLYNNGERWLVDCGPCGGEISGATRDSAIAAWNRRVI